MRAILVRHAASSGQAPEATISSEGQRQAVTLVGTLEKLSAGPLYASPYKRAMSTIDPFAQATSQQVTILEGLRERTLSPRPLTNWKDHVMRSFDDADFAPQGGESFNDLVTRAAPELNRVEELAGYLPTLVSHGNLMSALFQSCDPTFGYDDWQNLRNPDLFEVTVLDGRITAFQRLEVE